MQADLDGRWVVFRTADGTRDDDRGEMWLQTPEEYEADLRRATLTARLRTVGIVLDPDQGADTIPTDTLEQIAQLVQATASH